MDTGYDPQMAAHAGGGAIAFAVAMRAVKAVEIIPRRAEIPAALAIVLVLSLVAAYAAGEPILPALSASATGAILAISTHAAATKGG